MKRQQILVSLALVLVPAPAAHASTTHHASVPVPLEAGRSEAGWRVLAPVRAPFRFEMAGVRWRSDGPVRFALRTRTTGGAWTSWTPAERLDSSARSEPVWARGSRAVQVRVRGPGRLRWLRAEVVRADRPGPRRGLERALGPGLGAEAPVIVTRAEWGANESLRRDEPNFAPAAALAFVHHTATRNSYGEGEAAGIVRSIYTYHTRSLGWNDIGYNFLVDAYGRIYEGRAGGMERPVVGAHVRGFNTGTIGIAYLGNGEQQGLTSAARDALVELLSWRLDVAHVDPQARVSFVSGGSGKVRAGVRVTLRGVAGHRDADSTACPGRLVYADLDAIAAEANAIGLPKIQGPEVALGAGTASFTARVRGASTWTVSVLDAGGRTLRSQTGSGEQLRFAWDGLDTNGAAVDPATATWRIDAVDASGARARAATGAFVAGRTPPPAPTGPLELSPRVLSPNGDGVGDSLAISYELAVATTARIVVADASGVVVALPGPPVALPAGRHTASWDGLPAGGTTPVPDGRYRVLLQTIGATGEQTLATADMAVARAVAAIELGRTSASPNGDQRADRVPVRWRQDQLASVAIDLERRGQRALRLFEADVAPGPQEFVWDGAPSRALASGGYAIVVRAQTAGGEQTISRRLLLDTTAPMVREVRVRGGDAGGSARFRLSETSNVQITAGGRTVVPFQRRRSGPNGFRLAWDRRPAFATVTAQDLLGNRMKPVRVPVGR